MDNQTNLLDSEASNGSTAAVRRIPGWLKVSAIAAGSALAGGLAAAWFYRKALTRLQNAEQEQGNTKFGSSGEGGPEED